VAAARLPPTAIMQIARPVIRSRRGDGSRRTMNACTTNEQAAKAADARLA
jgi:hypothetical protein